MRYVFIALTVGFTVGGQLLIKAGMREVGPIPGELAGLLSFFVSAVSRWEVLLGTACGFAAAFSWMATVSVNPISFAYPFMALAIVLVLALSGQLFGETVSSVRWIGVAIVAIGLIVAARG